MLIGPIATVFAPLPFISNRALENGNRADGVEDEKYDVGDVTSKQNCALPTFEFAHNQCGDKRKACDRETEREVDCERLRVDGKGIAGFAEGYERAKGKNERQVDDVCADDVADGQIGFLLYDCGDCRDEFGK